MPPELATIWWAMVLLGLVAGTISGLLGVGSGIVVVPVLVMLYSFPQKSAQGMALAVMVPMALVGAIRYWVHPAIELNVPAIGLIVLGALAGAWLGAELAGRLPGHVLRRLFAIFILVVGVRLLIVPGNTKAKQAGDPPEATLIEGAETQGK